MWTPGKHLVAFKGSYSTGIELFYFTSFKPRRFGHTEEKLGCYEIIILIWMIITTSNWDNYIENSTSSLSKRMHWKCIFSNSLTRAHYIFSATVKTHLKHTWYGFCLRDISNLLLKYHWKFIHSLDTHLLAY